ncbi:tripartite tricarboxylate transporter permease [Pacificibacter marinus]|uniref:tripartite tricarboxylate transporter permease n=1 Tax=Pacificibacter marinus TaxID=658057 RepID=UPI001C069E17|nr:tripartite tricarboxylate transporter permease [Pacificibacter marinus]MBU2867463.1 tripartite tricarboxylate transporter permease [Pacificibacter marinus]
MNFIDFPALHDSFGILTQSYIPWLMIVPGLLIGLAGGALPGISGTMILALMLPVTPYMDFFTAIVFLTSVFTGAGYGGAVPAILVNMPGSTAAVATTFDGFPMARSGKHNEALGLGLAASTIGTLISYLVLFVLINFVAKAVLKLGPVEMAVVAIWGISMIAMLRGGNVERGILAGVFGLLIGTIGISPIGRMRGTFGLPELIDGVAVVPAMIGILATAELFNLARSKYIIDNDAARIVSFPLILKGFRDVFGYWRTLSRGSLIGIFVGAIPGVGASVANLVSYAAARRSDPDPNSYGKGNPNGLVASEAANSSSEGGAMGTLLALGLPGGGGTAVLLAAFAMHNVTGGPRFIADHKDTVYAILISNMVQSLLLIVVGLLFIRMAVVIIKIQVRHLVPTVIVIAMAGSYAITGNLTGPITLAIFSVIGWVFARYDYAPAAAVVGLLLGRFVESQFVFSHQLSGGKLSFILERPIALIMIAIFLISLVYPWINARMRCRKTNEE